MQRKSRDAGKASSAAMSAGEQKERGRGEIADVTVLDDFLKKQNSVFFKAGTGVICKKYKDLVCLFSKASTGNIDPKDKELVDLVGGGIESYRELMNRWLCMRVGRLFAGYFRQYERQPDAKAMVGVSAGLKHVLDLYAAYPCSYGERIVKEIADVIKEEFFKHALSGEGALEKIVNGAVNIQGVDENEALMLFLLELHPGFGSGGPASSGRAFIF